MKGFACLKINSAGWIEAEKPVPGPTDAILRPISVAICTSDVHVVEGNSGEKINVILGHEALGEVVEVGSEVKDFKPGDRVMVPAITPHWRHKNIQDSVPFTHALAPFDGMQFNSKIPGTFAEYFRVIEADMNMAMLPEGVTQDQALMIVDMVTTGFYGVEMADVQFGDSVMVIGIGPVGLMAVAGTALRGAGRIYAVGSRPDCIKLAQEYGATDIINYKNGDIVKQILELTKGRGVDKVIVAGGNNDTLGQALMSARYGATIANVNFLNINNPIVIPTAYWGMGMSDKTLRGGLCPGGRVRMERLAEIVRCGRFDPGKMVTHRFNGFDKIEDAYVVMRDKPKDLIKPVVYME